jgi:hypothetical protein
VGVVDNRHGGYIIYSSLIILNLGCRHGWGLFDRGQVWKPKAELNERKNTGLGLGFCRLDGVNMKRIVNSDPSCEDNTYLIVRSTKGVAGKLNISKKNGRKI